MREFQYAIGDDGIAIEVGEERFLLMFDRATLRYEEACCYVAEHSGSLPSVEQALIIQEFLPEINSILKDAGRAILSGWLWTNRQHAKNKNEAMVVNTNYGGMLWLDKSYTSLACIVIEL